MHIIGTLLLAFGMSSEAGIFLFSQLIGVKIISFSTLCLSAAFLSPKEKTLVSENNNAPPIKLIARFGIIYALLSLAGIPLTVGFSSTQSLYQILARESMHFFILLLISNFLTIIVALKLIKELFYVETGEGFKKNISKNEIFMVSLISFVVIVGFFPNFVATNFEKLAIGFEYLIK